MQPSRRKATVPNLHWQTCKFSRTELFEVCQEKILDKIDVIRYDNQGDSFMEKFVERTLLYDFYGELLTEHQQSIYEDVVLNDYSCTEVAEERGVSRQGVHDLIKRCDKILAEYEEKLHLVERFLKIRSKVMEIRDNPDASGKIKEISNEILEEL